MELGEKELKCKQVLDSSAELPHKLCSIGSKKLLQRVDCTIGQC